MPKRDWMAPVRRIPVAMCAVVLAAAAMLLPLAAAGEQLEAPSGAPGPQAASAAPSADFVVANRHIATLRVEVFGAGPADRADLAGQRLQDILRSGGPLAVTTRIVPQGTAVLVDGRVVFRILQGDEDAEAGDTVEGTAAAAAQNLQTALLEIRESEDAKTMLRAVGLAVLATLLLAAALWGLLRGYRWLARRVHELVDRRVKSSLPSWAGEVLGAATLGGLFTLPLKLVTALLVVLFSYSWAGFTLRRFPYTRPFGESLRHNAFKALGSFGESVIGAIPGLLFAALIFVLARIAVRVVRAFFAGVERGQIKVTALDETTARPTGRLVTAGIWLFALIAAYPYIPGSGSEAFKGIGVFLGLMMSIGASGVVGQAVSGLMLMYTRALRPGEYVQIGDVEGTVRTIGFLATRVETLRREEINIPNALIATTIMRNHSRLAAGGGIWVPTKVTIGYDTPWRQVRALLLLAAGRTEGVGMEPPPRVLQTALQDFYVEYTLVVSVKDPAYKLVTLDVLHANIQDAFNEYGVQIMSPNYRGDPESPKIVPQDKWFEPPANRQG